MRLTRWLIASGLLCTGFVLPHDLTRPAERLWARWYASLQPGYRYDPHAVDDPSRLRPGYDSECVSIADRPNRVLVFNVWCSAVPLWLALVPLICRPRRTARETAREISGAALWSFCIAVSGNFTRLWLQSELQDAPEWLAHDLPMFFFIALGALVAVNLGSRPVFTGSEPQPQGESTREDFCSTQTGRRERGV